MQKVLGIVRASTDKQETESQKKELIEFLTGTHGFTENQVVIIETAGASAYKRNKKYMDLLDNIKATIIKDPDIKAVGLWNLDRLGRHDDTLVIIKNWFIENKVQLYCKSPSLTLLKADGTVDQGAEIAYGVFAALVKQQTEDLFNKTKRGKDRNRRQGKYNGGPVAYGYMVDPSGFLVPDTRTVLKGKSKADIVKEAITEYVNGQWSLESLTKEFRERGYPGGWAGTKFTLRTLECFFKNPMYAGLGNVPGIVDKDLWEKANLKRTGRALRSSKQTKHYWLGIGLLKCPWCGSSYIADTKYYMCMARKTRNRAGHKDCPGNPKMIKIEILDNLLWGYTETAYLAWLANYNSLRINELEKRKSVVFLKSAEIQKKIDSLEDLRERAKELYLSGEIGKQEFEKHKARVLQTWFQYQADHEKLMEELDTIDSSLGTPVSDLSGLTEKERQELVRRFVKSIEFSGDSLVITMKDGHKYTEPINPKKT